MVADLVVLRRARELAIGGGRTCSSHCRVGRMAIAVPRASWAAGAGVSEIRHAASADVADRGVQPGHGRRGLAGRIDGVGQRRGRLGTVAARKSRRCPIVCDSFGGSCPRPSVRRRILAARSVAGTQGLANARSRDWHPGRAGLDRAGVPSRAGDRACRACCCRRAGLPAVQCPLPLHGASGQAARPGRPFSQATVIGQGQTGSKLPHSKTRCLGSMFVP